MSAFTPMPAIDLREGAVVQLVGGDYERERVRLADVHGVARGFREAGLAWLHVVDLDAATGRGEPPFNGPLVEALARGAGMRVQAGGGVRSVERARALTSAGALRVVVGTRAVQDEGFRAELVAELPGQVVLALDVRGDEVLVAGWKGSSGRRVEHLLDEVAELPLAGVLVTAVHVEGGMQGPDVALVERLAARTRHSLVASGGVGRVEDVAALREAGARAVVVGMALYTGAIDPVALAKEAR